MSKRYSHKCGEECICPIHKTYLWYNRTHNEHACQSPFCKYAHGLERALAEDDLREFLRR